VFRRVDVKPVEEIRARADLVHDTRLSTCMEQNGVRIATVEHLMSALSGLGVDNAYIDLDSAEVPIMDGSAGTFIFLLQSAVSSSNPPPRNSSREEKHRGEAGRQVGALRSF